MVDDNSYSDKKNMLLNDKPADLSLEQHIHSVVKIIGLTRCVKCDYIGDVFPKKKHEEYVLVCANCGSSDWRISTSASIGG